MPESLVLDRPAPAVARLTFNRPDRLNAFNPEMKNRLHDEIRRLSRDPEVNAIILRGAGRAFSVGVDLTKSAEGGARPEYTDIRSATADFETLRDSTVEVFLDIWRAPVPVIAQVHGYCMGVAAVLIQCCDVVYAADDAIFGWPGVPLGGGMIGPSWLQQIGAHRAKELSFTIGSRVSARQAHAWGVVNRLTAVDRLDEATVASVAHMARVGRDLLRVKKEAINQAHNRTGFEEVIRASAVWDAVSHEADIVTTIREEIVDGGIKSILGDWRPPTDIWDE